MRDPLRLALLALTFVTGVVDAVAFLALDQVFAAMMTGNVLFLGFGIAGSAGAPVVAPLAGIAAFIAGGMAGGLAIARSQALDRRRALAVAAAIEVPLLAAAAVYAATSDVEAGEASGIAVLALLAVAMGARNTIVRRIGERELPTTVLTVAVASLGAGTSPVASGEHLAPRAAAIAVMLCGAIAGALLLQQSMELAIAAAAALTLAAWAGFALKS